MSGSIVGTPIHMAPELFTGTNAQQFHNNSLPNIRSAVLLDYISAKLITKHVLCSVLTFSLLLAGKYDNSVDVYAFGILFWYLCTGSVKLPEAFEKCSSKDQLWNNVKKGK